MDLGPVGDALGTASAAFATWVVAYALVWVGAIAAYAGLSLLEGPRVPRHVGASQATLVAIFYGPFPASLAAFGSWWLLALTLAICALPWVFILASIVTQRGSARPTALLRALVERRRGRLGEGVAALAAIHDAAAIGWLVRGSTPAAAGPLAEAAQASFELDDAVHVAYRRGLVPEAALARIASRSAVATSALWRSCDGLAVTRASDEAAAPSIQEYLERVDRLRDRLDGARDGVAGMGVNRGGSGSLDSCAARLDAATSALIGGLPRLSPGSEPVGWRGRASGPDRDAADIEIRLDQCVATVRGRLPGETVVLARVMSIRSSILSVLRTNPLLDLTDPNDFALRQTALSYLPEALSRYLRVPSGNATSARDEAHALLVQQLDVLDRAMRDVTQAVADRAASELAVHGRFLEERFRRSALTIPRDSGLR